MESKEKGLGAGRGEAVRGQGQREAGASRGLGREVAGMSKGLGGHCEPHEVRLRPSGERGGRACLTD